MSFLEYLGVRDEKSASPGTSMQQYAAPRVGATQIKSPMQRVSRPEPQTTDPIEQVADFALSMIPGAKLAINWNNEVEKFKALPEEDQREAVAWEAVGVALFALPVAGAVLGNVWKGRQAARAATRAKKYFQPIEDLTSWTSESYSKTLRSKLLSRDYGLNEVEAQAVERFINGRPRALDSAYTTQIKPSTGFKNLVKATPEGPLSLTDEAADAFAPKNLRREKFLDDYKHTTYDKLRVYGKTREYEIHKNSFPLHEAAYAKVIGKLYGKEAELTANIANATVEELAAARQFMRGHEAPALIRSVNSPGSAAMLRRVGSVFGRGEPAFKTRSMGYDLVEKGSEAASLKRLGLMKKLDEMLAQPGRDFLRAGKRGLEATGKLTKAVEQRTLNLIRRVGEIEKINRKASLLEVRALVKEEIGKAIPLNTAEDYAVRDLFQTLVDFNDFLYADRMRMRLWEALEARETTALGRARIEKLMEELEPTIKETFSSQAGKNVLQKNEAIDSILSTVRERLETEGKHWYDLSKMGDRARARFMPRRLGVEFRDKTGNLRKVGGMFRQRAEGGTFPKYEMNPLSLVATGKARPFAILHGEQGVAKSVSEFYHKVSQLGKTKEMSLEREIVRKISNHANELYLMPQARKAASHFSKLPPAWKTYFEHYLARKLHLPSRTDMWVAQVLERTVGAAQRAVGRTGLADKLPNKNWTGVYDSYDVVNMAKTINDITYVAFLGFKPFSAMRNYLQPLMMVPTDLGGIKDIGTLGRAYKAVLQNIETKPGVKILEELRAMGVIPEEFTGEFANQSYKLFRRRNTLLGAPTPTWDDTRRAALWMFSNSHNHNCYVTGAAAILKWDDAVKKLGYGDLRGFLKKAGVTGRRDDVRAEIELLLRNNQRDLARTTFVRSVVEDTQFIYGTSSTPLITQSFGGAGKTAAIFQTWWMNYGDTIGKWLTTGKADVKAARAISFTLSTAAAYSLMRTIWEHDVAASTVGLGPFGSIQMMREGPPAWRLAGQALRTLTTIGGLAESEDAYTDQVKKQMAALAKQSLTFAPGGLQFKQTLRRAEEEGMEGALKSIIRYKKD